MSLGHLVAWLTGLEGEIVWRMSKPDEQSCRCLDTSKTGEVVWGPRKDAL